MQSITGRAVSAAATPACHAAKEHSSGWVRRHRGLVIASIAVAGAAGLALTQRWASVADLAPLLLVLPCATMMFVCTKGIGHKHGAASKDPPPTSRV